MTDTARRVLHALTRHRPRYAGAHEIARDLPGLTTAEIESAFLDLRRFGLVETRIKNYLQARVVTNAKITTKGS